MTLQTPYHSICPRPLISTLIGLLLLLCCTPVPAQQSYEDLTFPPLQFTPPEVERHTLTNGIQLFLVPDHELPVISLYALMKTGAIYEPEEKIGLAALTAEVMRTGGTEKYGPDAINETLEFLASSVEVDIGDETGSVGLWTLKKNFAASLDVFVDVLRTPQFEQEKVDLAKAQMLEGIRRRNDMPQSIRSREFMRILYGRMHPLARIPQVETVTAITRDDLVAFHQRYFHPNTTMLAVTGDFETEDMIQTLETAFQGWPPAEVSLPEIETVPYTLQRSVNMIHKDVDQSNLMLGHLGIKADNPDYPAIRILDLILGSGGFSSRLFQSVRNEKGLAYSIGSNLGAGILEYGAFVIYCDTRNDAVKEVITTILEELHQLIEHGVSKEELERAKNQYLNSFIFKFASVQDIVQRQMFYEYFDYPSDYLETFRKRVLEVTAADVQRVAQKYLHPEHLHILAVGDTAVIRSQLAAFGDVQELVLDPVE